jgi:hypothetical protein
MDAKVDDMEKEFEVIEQQWEEEATQFENRLLDLKKRVEHLMTEQKQFMGRILSAS